MIFLPKSQPAPACLEVEKQKTNGTYNCGDVVKRLQNDFKNKCYLCEEKAPSTINTEHFQPHKGNKNLKFDWNNLFFCCGHCNNTKLAKPEFDEILNCTIDADGVDTKIKYEMKPYPKEKAIITALEDDARVKNTALLLNIIYNGTTPIKQIESENIRGKLLDEIVDIQSLLIKYYNGKYTEDEKFEFKKDIVRHLNPTSHFTAFKKWIIRENEIMNTEFGAYL